MGNESRRSNDGKTNGSTTEGTKSMGNSRDSRPTITASERALNGAILAAEISESFEEHLEIFDHFYADEEHHYDHHQIGGPLTFSDLRLSGGETAGNVSTRLAKPQ